MFQPGAWQHAIDNNKMSKLTGTLWELSFPFLPSSLFPPAALAPALALLRPSLSLLSPFVFFINSCHSLVPLFRM